MIQYSKEILIYRGNIAFNLNSLLSSIKNKIDKILRVNPVTGASYQVWAPGVGVYQFSSLNCGEIYVIESNSINYEISNNLIYYNTNLCSDILPTPTTTKTLTPTPTPTRTPTATPTLTPTPTPSSISQDLRISSLDTDILVYDSLTSINISSLDTDVLVFDSPNKINISSLNTDVLIYSS